MLLSDYLNIWLETYVKPKRAKNTVRDYESALAHLSDQTQSTDLQRVDALTLQREINQLAKVYSRQAQIMYTALHAAYKKALMLRLIQANPMDLVEKPEHEKREAEYLTVEEASAYIDAAATVPAGPLLVLMLCIGLRRNEARGLRCGDLDSRGILHITHQRTRDGNGPLKSKSSRRLIPLPDALRAYFSGPHDDYVVDCSEKSLRTQHKQVLRAIGCDKHVTLHGLRHSFATAAIVDGAELVTVQKLLGHAHISLTADLYVHPDLAILGHCANVVYGAFCSRNMGMGARLEIV